MQIAIEKSKWIRELIIIYFLVFFIKKLRLIKINSKLEIINVVIVIVANIVVVIIIVINIVTIIILNVVVITANLSR